MLKRGFVLAVSRSKIIKQDLRDFTYAHLGCSCPFCNLQIQAQSLPHPRDKHPVHRLHQVAGVFMKTLLLSSRYRTKVKLARAKQNRVGNNSRSHQDSNWLHTFPDDRPKTPYRLGCKYNLTSTNGDCTSGCGAESIE